MVTAYIPQASPLYLALAPSAGATEDEIVLFRVVAWASLAGGPVGLQPLLIGLGENCDSPDAFLPEGWERVGSEAHVFVYAEDPAEARETIWSFLRAARHNA